MIYYVECRVKFERIDREGLTGSLASLPSMSLAVFIFKMKILRLGTDLVGRDLRAWESRWRFGRVGLGNRPGRAFYFV
jgi:hypothetical protein